MRADDSLGLGMDAAFTILVFFGIGFALDHWLGTTPWLMITLAMGAAVGLFIAWKARYMATMEQLEDERRRTASSPRPVAGHGAGPGAPSR